MRKPDFNIFLKTKEEFDRVNRSKKMRQQLVPYLISSHPGCTQDDMRRLIRTMHENRILPPEQVQDFTPTPMTLSSVMYYCGFNPYTGKKMYVARQKEEKMKQKELLTCIIHKERG